MIKLPNDFGKKRGLSLSLAESVSQRCLSELVDGRQGWVA